MRKKYILILLIFFSTHIFSMVDGEEKARKAQTAALLEKFREKKSYVELESELQQCKDAYQSFQERSSSKLKDIRDKLRECYHAYDNDLVDKNNELTTLKQRTTFLENQLTHAHSFEGWLSHRATLPACASVMLLAAYKRFAMPRLHAWAQKIRKPTWKKRVLQLLACDWLRRRRFVRRRGRKKRKRG